MRFVAIGECMVELSGAGEGLFAAGFAGDTFNTAWYVKAAGGIEVAYGTVLGSDAMSARMIDFIADAGIDTSGIGRHPVRSPGLYMISLKDGERSFTYWRDTSAARTLADDPVWLAGVIDGADMVYISGITLAILTADRRQVLLDTLASYRAKGGKVAFDPNLRPRLWPDSETMCAAIMQAAAVSDIALPSYEDEAEYFGDADLTGTAQRYANAGVTEVIVKNGGGDMLAWAEGKATQLPMGGAVKPVDTTGAGDSFNGGYLAARMKRASVQEAAQAGHAIALRVIGHRGALIPQKEMATA